MQHPQQFVASLLELRAHYQSLQQEYERSCVYLTEQLSHVNALLVDQLVENQQLVERLMELRAHYQAAHEELQQKVARAKEQLNHVNALLAEQLVLQHNGQQPVAISAATVEERERQVLAGTSDSQLQEPPQLPLEVAIAPPHPFNQQQELPQTQPQSEESAPPEPLEPHLPSATSKREPSQAAEPKESSDVAELTKGADVEVKAAVSERARPLTPPKTPLLPQYANLNKQQAVEQLLREHSGSILDTDYIIYSLHGKLEPEEIKQEKLRMYDTLKKGVEKGLWDRVPDSPGCYTLDLKLINSDSSQKKAEDNKRQGQKSKRKSKDEILPRYQNLSLIEAVETVVRENQGQILTTDKVARELYGELKGYALTKAKEKVGKTLWHGAKQGLWQRVPQQMGCYTLDLEELTSKFTETRS